MSARKITPQYLALQNLKRKPFRTVCLILITALLSASVFGGWMLISGLRNGMNSMQNRLGADIMVVPAGYEADMEELLLRGEPSTFYLDAAIADTVLLQEGIAQASPQYFATSLSESCCTDLLQLIGIDPGTDFTVRPWVNGHPMDLADGDILVGANILAGQDGTLRFFGQDFTVSGQLEQTATGFDNSVFMTIETAQSMLENAKKDGYNFLAQDGNSISSVLVEIAPGYDAVQVATQIKKALPEVDTVVSGNIIRSISGNLNGFTKYLVALWLSYCFWSP